MRMLIGAIALLIAGLGAAWGQSANGYNPTPTQARPFYLTDPNGNPSTLPPATAAVGKTAPWFASLSANTSTQLLAANPQRISVSIQCAGSGPVAISETGAALTTATPAAGSNITLVIPNGSSPYFIPPITSQGVITGYTGTPQTCWGAEYLR